MSNRSVIPFGPQHPVLPEPIHLDLVMEDEKVVEAIPSIGFIHRGLEKLVDKKDFTEMVYVAERICGICSLGHGLGYSEAVEPDISELSGQSFQGSILIYFGSVFLPMLSDLRAFIWTAGGLEKKLWICSKHQPADELSFPL